MFSTWIGVVLLFAFFGLLALVVIGALPRGNTYEEKRAKARAEKLQTVREETTKALTTYAWVNKSKGVVRIPINDAMKLTVAELAQKSTRTGKSDCDAGGESTSAKQYALCFSRSTDWSSSEHRKLLLLELSPARLPLQPLLRRPLGPRHLHHLHPPRR